MKLKEIRWKRAVKKLNIDILRKVLKNQDTRRTMKEINKIVKKVKWKKIDKVSPTIQGWLL